MSEPVAGRHRRAGLVALTLAFAVAVALVESTVAAPTKTPPVRDCTATAPGPPSDRCPLEISLGDLDTFTRAIAPLAPGDTVARPLGITNTGKVALASITLATTHDGQSPTVVDALRLTIERCSVPWSSVGGSYLCNGTSEELVGDAAIGTAHDLGAGLSSLQPGGTDRLLATLAVPDELDQQLQGTAAAITYAFTATQRTAK